ncbi:helix-turn-helix domain-containing protein [Haladaptatus cibarius]|uniref:helix-turn-helix domain-containing protein n=1 Tax=Haladaptatus cibarius TaxID=453847 RepID=UPI000678972E|nr:bacterio-opsin activator domain-containing protein [Haladaptatus cibarius]
MSTIAEIALPASEFALREAFSRIPGARFEIVGVVAHDAEHVMPQMQATASDIAVLQSALETDPSVTDVTLLTTRGNRGLFWMNWCETGRKIVHLLAESDTTVLAAHAANSEWRFRIQSGDRDALSSVYESCRDAGYPVEIQNVHEQTTLTENSRGLTTQQYETLQTAIDRGYYDIPRNATTEDLADELGCPIRPSRSDFAVTIAVS